MIDLTRRNINYTLRNLGMSPMCFVNPREELVVHASSNKFRSTILTGYYSFHEDFVDIESMTLLNKYRCFLSNKW